MPTYDTSDRYALRALEGDNPVSDIDAGFAALRDDISAKLTPYDSGLLAARPVSTGGTPGKAGRIYRATDDTSGGPNGTLYVDHGTGWLPLMGVDSDLTALAALTTTSYGRALLEAATPTWTAATMQNSWTSGGAGDVAGYTKDALGVVHMRGKVIAPGSSTAAALTLPAGFRPAQPCTFMTVTDSGDEGAVDVATTGQLTIHTGSGGTMGAAGTTRLSPVSFPTW